MFQSLLGHEALTKIGIAVTPQLKENENESTQ